MSRLELHRKLVCHGARLAQQAGGFPGFALIELLFVITLIAILALQLCFYVPS